MGRILVIRGGALGDFVLTLPVLAALRAQFPAVRLEVLGYPNFARLALAGGLADDVHAIEARPLAGFFARQGPLDDTMSAFFARFAVIISFLYDPDGIFQENIRRCSPAQFIVGPHRPDERGSRHAVETFLEPLERLAIFATGLSPRLDLQPLRPGPGEWLAVHPGSGSESKNWPEDCWARLLARWIEQTPSNCLLLGGEAEGDRLERLARRLPAHRLCLLRSQPLDRVGSHLCACQGFAGHDSGITHLAAAVGLPGLALWGPSNVTLWRPRSSRFQVIAAGPRLQDLPVDAVWSALVQHCLPAAIPALRPPADDGSVATP